MSEHVMINLKDGNTIHGDLVGETDTFYVVLKKIKNYAGEMVPTYKTCVYKDEVDMIL